MAAPVDVDVHEHGTITAVDVTVLAGAVVGKTFASAERHAGEQFHHLCCERRTKGPSVPS